MAVDLGLDQTTRYYEVTDAAALDFPNGPWCIGIWTRIDENAGADFNYLISNNTYNIADSFTLYLRQDAGSGNGGKWQLNSHDTAGNAWSIDSSSTPGGDGKNRLIICQRAANSTGELHFCVAGAASTLEGTDASVHGAMVSTQNWDIGRRVDGHSTRYYEEHFGGYFRGNMTLTPDEITAIGQGVMPWHFGALDWYLPFHQPSATVFDLIGPHNAVRQGASYPGASEDFPELLVPPILVSVPSPPPPPLVTVPQGITQIELVM